MWPQFLSKCGGLVGGGLLYTKPAQEYPEQHVTFNRSFCKASMLQFTFLHLRLVSFLLHAGADPSQANADHKYPLNNLLRQHIHHHDPLALGGVSLNLTSYLATMGLVCHTMDLSALGYVFSVYKESGFWGVICREECPVYRLLQDHCCTGVRRLKHACRLIIWRTLGQRFQDGCQELPLPTELRNYISQIGTSVEK